MAEIKWRTTEEIEEERNKFKQPSIEELKAEIEQLKEAIRNADSSKRRNAY